MSAYRFPECANCSFHDVEPAICEQCVNGSEFRDSFFETPEGAAFLGDYDLDAE